MIRLLINSEVIMALSTRATQGIVMLCVVVAAILGLNPDEQGFFFTFMSFGALLQLSDFGLSYAVLHTSSHLVATKRADQLAQLRQLAFRRILFFIIVAAVAVGIVGGILLSRQASPTSSFMAPWLAMVLSVSLMQLTTPLLAIAEGGGVLAATWRLRFVQELCSGIVFVGCLLLGWKLWSIAAYWLARAAIAAVWLRLHQAPSRFSQFSVRRTFNWLEEVWPFQWRIGLSALSGFLVFQAINPIIFAEHGPVVAGKFGLSFAMMNMLLLITSAWPLSQAARFGALISDRRFDEVKRLFHKVLLRSTFLAMVAAGCLSVAIVWLTEYGMSFVSRFADSTTTLLLLAASVVHHIVGCVAVLLRSERREPLLLASVVGGAMTILGLWLAARWGGPREIALTNLALAAIGIPIVYLLHRRQMSEWHTTIQASH